MHHDSYPIKDSIASILWTGLRLRVLDQRLLPQRIKYLECRTYLDVAQAIRDMALRGAPLIGCAAAYGMALAAQKGHQEMNKAAKILLNARPTAVNLAHAVEFMLAQSSQSLNGSFAPRMAQAAQNYYKDDLGYNRIMAKLGSSLLKKGAKVITYCNAGALATSGLGTSLGVIRYAHHLGKISHVYCCETRPYLQGSRLTLWELMQARVPCTLITDNAAAHLMKTGSIDAVIVGSDRIVANGDVCNKIGTYGLAILARHHKIPLYVVAPSSTVDMRCPNGSRIPIEERSEEEVLTLAGRRLAPKGARARHFAFDVTPNSLVSAIVTEKGIVQPVNGPNLKEVLS